jgi:hypothetical protein
MVSDVFVGLAARCNNHELKLVIISFWPIADIVEPMASMSPNGMDRLLPSVG